MSNIPITKWNTDIDGKSDKIDGDIYDMTHNRNREHLRWCYAGDDNNLVDGKKY